jgi:hypothetical protein
MLLSSLEVKLGISGDAAVVSGLKRVQQAEDQAAGGSSALSSAFSAMEIPALRVVSAVSGVATALISLSAGAIAASGIRLAAQYERVELGFKTLLGSASAAHQLMADISKLGQTTPFKTQELTQYARQLLATDASANKAVNTLRILKAVTDTMAATGGTTADVGEVASVIGQMRVATHIDIEQIKTLSRLGVNVTGVYKAATGKDVAPQIAMARLANMQGPRAAETILKGMEKLYGGAAASQAATGLGLLQNIIETLGLVALPTGVALLTVIKPFAEFILKILTAAQKINEMTHGIVGLSVILILVIRGWTLISTVIRAAYTATTQLTAALIAYSNAARTAASSTNTAAAASTGAAGVGGAAAAAGAAAAGAGGASAAAGGVAAASGATGIKLLWQALKGGGVAAVATELKAMLGGVGGFLKSPLGAGLAGWAATAVGGMMQGSTNARVKNAGDYVSGAGTGVSLGALAAIFLPGPWKLAAIAIGGVAGAIKTWWDKSHPEKPPTPESPMAVTNAILKDIHAVLIGGGDRANRVKSELEAEYSLRHAVLTGGG